jgi:hypothetical protein
MGYDGELELAGSDYILLPRGTSGQRPQFPEVGMVRYNTDTSQFETWTGAAWGSLAQASGAIPSLTEITTFTPSTSNTVEFTNETVGVKTGSIGQTTTGGNAAISIKQPLSITGGVTATGLVSSPTLGFSGNLSGDVSGDIVSTGTSDFSGTVDLTGANITGYTPIAIADGTASLNFNVDGYLQTDTDFLPAVSGTQDIGNSLLKWNNGYFNGSLVLDNVNVSGDEINDRLNVPGINFSGDIIPGTDSAYDIGSADKKIQHLFLSSNSLWLGDEHKIDAQEGKVKIKKRDKSVVPSVITGLGGTEAGLLSASVKASLGLVTLADLLAYMTSLDADLTTVEDLFPVEGDVGYDAADYIEIIDQSLSSRYASQLFSAVSSVTCDLYQGNEIVVDGPTSDISINVIGASNIEGVTVSFTVYINQGSTVRTISGVNFAGVAAAQFNLEGAGGLGNDEVNMIDFKAVFIGGSWRVTGVVGGVGGVAGAPGADANISWSISADGTSNYVFDGPGITTDNTSDPILYLYKGFTYTFVNTTGSSHPFAIRVSSGGADYTPGVSGSQTGTQTFVVPMNAPSTLYYQCTIHGSMGNAINIV